MIICYNKILIIRFIKNCYSILLMNNIVDNFKNFTYFEYLIFFNKKDVHHLKNLLSKNEFTFGINNKDKTDLNEIFLKNLYENIF